MTEDRAARKGKISPDPDKAADALVAIRPRGLLKVVTISAEGDTPRVRCFTLPGERDAMRDYIAAADGKRNVYFEPNPPKVKADKRSKESDIAAAVFAYVDCDPKLDGKPEEPAKAQARHHERLNSDDVPAPTFEYVSGGGTVALWRHAAAIKLDGPESIEAAKSINIGVARALGKPSDGYDTCQSLDHLYRAPNTTNLPNAKKRKAGRSVSVAGDLEAHPDRRYARDEFPAVKVAPITTTTKEIGDAADVDLDALEISTRLKSIIEAGEAEGKRPNDDSPSGWRMSLIMGLKKEGISDEQILGILMHPDNAVSADRAKRAGSDKSAEVFFKKEISKATRMNDADRQRKHAEAVEDFADDVDDASLERFKSSPSIMGDIDDIPTVRFDLAPYEPKDPTKIPMRAWLYKPGYIRKFIGLTAATGGAGKSSLILVEAVAMAAGKNLLGIEPEGPLRALYWNGEDPQEELERRVEAILKYYKVTKDDLGGRLFIRSGRDQPIRIAESEDGKASIAEPIVAAMIAAITEHELDVVILDPFVSSHGVLENDNNGIDMVAKKWADIADKTNCSIMLSHHTRKTGGGPASIEDSRGASALNYAARTRRAINTMSAAEAKGAGITDDRTRLSYFKADMAGSSMAKPTAAHDWYRFESVSLMNGPIDELTGKPGEGDSVGVVVAWEYKKLTLELSPELALEAVSALEDGGPWRANKQADNWAGKAIAKAAGVDLTDAAVRTQIAALLAEWLNDGVIEEYEAEDEHRKPKKCLRPTNIDFG